MSEMKKSKFNWGTGILITIIVFMIVPIGTVVFLMNQDVDLVATDYYNKGIQHQEQIDRHKLPEQLIQRWHDRARAGESPELCDQS